jgi:hypothetical protein
MINKDFNKLLSEALKEYDAAKGHCKNCEAWNNRNISVQTYNNYYQVGMPARVYKYCPDCGRKLEEI